MAKINKYVCPNSYARDGFNVPLALYEIGLLEKLFIERPLKYHSRLYDHREMGDMARLDKYAFFLDVQRRLNIFKSKRDRSLYEWYRISQQVGSSAAEYVSRYDVSGMVSELYSANSAFGGVAYDVMKILFQTHPYSRTLVKQYEKASRIYGIDFSDELELCQSMVADSLSYPAQAANVIICASEYTKSSIIVSGEVNCSDIFVVPYGVDAGVFRFRKKQFISGKPMQIIYVGQNVARKGLDILLDEWGAGISGVELLIAGFDVTDEQKIDAYNRNIYFLGRLCMADLIGYIQSSDYLILPSFAEGFGLVLLESISCGTPIIGSVYSAAVDILDHYDVGVIVDPLIRGDIRQTICLLEGSRDKALAQSDNCREARQYYTWQRFRSVLGDLFFQYMPL